jgi:hypothetical protein
VDQYSSMKERARVKGAVTDRGWLAVRAVGVAEAFQSSIRSRCADLGALRCSGAQSRGRPSVVCGGHDIGRARPGVRIACAVGGAIRTAAGPHGAAMT